MSERLGPQPGERIDRKRPVRFRFEGRRFQGFQGDTLSTALWASGVRVLDAASNTIAPAASSAFAVWTATPSPRAGS